MDMWQLSKEEIRQVLDTALTGGGDFADLYMEYREITGVGCEEDRIENITTGVDQGAGIRVIDGDRSLYMQTNDLTLNGLLEAAKEAAKANGKERTMVAQELKDAKPAFSEVKEDPKTVPIEEKTQVVLSANKVAREYSEKVLQVTITYVDHRKKIMIANSEGTFSKEERTTTRFSINVVAKEKDIVQTGFESRGGITGFEIVRENAEELARLAAQRAVNMLSARPAPAGRMTVVMSSEAGGTMVHEACGHGLEADLIYHGMSVYAGKLGEKVASEKVTVIDDATIAGRYGYIAYDDEGTKAEKTVLIEKGVLKQYMSDLYYAKKLGLKPTGNGRRESYAYKPIPRMTNTYIASGEDDPEEIIRSTEKGLFVSRMGGGQVNTTNGDFVFDIAEGFLIENGKIGNLVRGATLVGNGPQVLKDIEMVGRDLGFSLGVCGKDGQGVPVSDAQPTIKIKSLTVGGLIEEGDK